MALVEADAGTTDQTRPARRIAKEFHELAGLASLELLKTFDLAHKRGRCAKPKDRNTKFCSAPRGVGNGERPPESASDKLV